MALFSLERLRELSKLDTFACQDAASLENTVVFASWVRSYSSVTANANGVTGWLTFRHSSEHVRSHLCSASPCVTAHYPASKYGMYGPPKHFRWLPSVPIPAAEPALAPTVVAEPALSPTVVAEPALAPTEVDPETVLKPTEIEPPTETAAELNVEQQQGDDVCPTPAPDATVETETFEAPALALPLHQEPAPEAERRPLIPAPMLLPCEIPPEPINISNTPTGKIMALAREIRRPRQYIGYFGWLAFALMEKVAVFMWEGMNRLNLVETFAPWAIDHCNKIVVAEAIFCRFSEEGCYQVSETNPLHVCSHYVVGIPVESSTVVAQSAEDLSLSEDPLPFETFYLTCGMAVRYTIADGDCALDSMCIMLGEERTFDNRQKLREQLHDFLICNAEHKGLQDACRASQEFTVDDPSPPTTVVAQVAAVSEVKEQELTHSGIPNNAKTEFTAEELEAVSWACGFKNVNAETTLAVCRSLPSAVVTEQVELYRQRVVSIVPQKVEEIKPHQCAKYGRGYRRNLLKTRLAIGEKFHLFIKQHNSEECKLPKGDLKQFFKQTEEFNGISLEDEDSYARQRKFVHRCLNLFLKTKGQTMLGTNATRNTARGDGQRRHVRDFVRKNVHGASAVHRVKAPLVRTQLFEWFSVMRHSVKTRIPAKVLEVKAKQITQDYVTASLLNGIKPDPPTINAKWLKRWQMEYAVSLRKPNRKYKVPKKVLEDRLQTFWKNIARLRAAAIKLLGYDLDFINMDQSPFHMNEAGSVG